MTKRRNLRLRDPQHLGSIGLRELARFKHLIQGIGQAQLGLTLGSVGEPEVSEHVSGAASDRLHSFSTSACHGAPHEPSRQFSGAALIEYGNMLTVINECKQKA